MTQRQIDYREYLKSEHWFNLRSQVLNRDGRQCIRCRSKFRLQAHHTIYRDKFEDSLVEDLITLCRSCHEKEHGIRQKKKPRIEKGPVDLTTVRGIHEARSRRKISRKEFKRLIAGMPKEQRNWHHTKRNRHRGCKKFIPSIDPEKCLCGLYRGAHKWG